MPSVVIRGGKVKCSHAGVAPLSQGSPKLAVNGMGVIVSGMETGISFAVVPPAIIMCPHLSGSNNPSPCTSTSAATSGVSAKLLVDGLGVLLDTAKGDAVNANDPLASWQISDPGQSILTEV